jgi:hypothetical protein
MELIRVNQLAKISAHYSELTLKVLWAENLYRVLNLDRACESFVPYEGEPLTTNEEET